MESEPVLPRATQERTDLGPGRAVVYKGITMDQPWAAAFVYSNRVAPQLRRRYRTDYRGTIFIRAGVHWGGIRSMDRKQWQNLDERYGPTPRAMTDAMDALIGMARLVDCVDFGEGRWLWELAEKQPIRPVRFRAPAEGVFDVPLAALQGPFEPPWIPSGKC